MRTRKFVFSLAFVLGCLGLLEGLARLLIPPRKTGILANRPVTALYTDIERPEEVFSEVTPDLLEWAPYEHWVMKPNLRGRFFRTNALGLRGPEIETPKPEGRFRIIVMGGSAAWGYGCTADESTVPGQLKRFLQERRPDLDVDVINAGQIGFVSGQELVFFHRLIKPLDPDLVILFDGYNDVAADFQNAMSGWPQNAVLLRSRYEASWTPWPSRLDLTGFLRKSRLLDEGLRSFTRQRPQPQVAAIKSIETARNYVRNARAISRLATATPIFVALQPTIPTISKPLAPEEQRMLAEKEASFSAFAVRLRKTYGLIAEQLRLSGLPFIDLHDALGSDAVLMFADECHFGDAAASSIAAVLAESIDVQMRQSAQQLAQ